MVKGIKFCGLEFCQIWPELVLTEDVQEKSAESRAGRNRDVGCLETHSAPSREGNAWVLARPAPRLRPKDQDHIFSSKAVLNLSPSKLRLDLSSSIANTGHPYSSQTLFQIPPARNPSSHPSRSPRIQVFAIYILKDF